jgi:hypothetical protein
MTTVSQDLTPVTVDDDSKSANNQHQPQQQSRGVSTATLKRRAAQQMKDQQTEKSRPKSRERKPIFERKMNSGFFDGNTTSEVEIYEGHKVPE